MQRFSYYFAYNQNFTSVKDVDPECIISHFLLKKKLSKGVDALLIDIVSTKVTKRSKYKYKKSDKQMTT